MKIGNLVMKRGMTLFDSKLEDGPWLVWGKVKEHDGNIFFGGATVYWKLLNNKNEFEYYSVNHCESAKVFEVISGDNS